MRPVPFWITSEHKQFIRRRRHGPGASNSFGHCRWFALPVTLFLPNPRGLNHEVDRLRVLWRLTFEIPKPQIVVAIGGLNRPVARVKLHAHLAQIVADQAA